MYLNYLDQWLPSKSSSLELMCLNGEISEKELFLYRIFFGLDQVKRDPLITPLDQCRLLLDKLFDIEAYRRLSIDYIIIVHTGDIIFPPKMNLEDFFVQRYHLHGMKLLSTTGHNCATGLYWLSLINNLMQSSDIAMNIILLCVDITTTSYLREISQVSLFSDGASVALFSSCGDGHSYIGENTLLLSEFHKGVWSCDLKRSQFEDIYFNCLCQLLEDLLSKLNIALWQIKFIVPHNVNLMLWQSIGKYFNLLSNSIYTENIRCFSHAFNADAFINLKSILDQDLLLPGDYYILVSVGLGATFTAVLFQA